MVAENVLERADHTESCAVLGAQNMLGSAELISTFLHLNVSGTGTSLNKWLEKSGTGWCLQARMPCLITLNIIFFYTHTHQNQLLFASRQRGIFYLYVGCANTQGTFVI